MRSNEQIRAIAVSLTALLATMMIVAGCDPESTQQVDDESSAPVELLTPMSEVEASCPQHILGGDALIESEADLEGLAGVTWLSGRLTITGDALDRLSGLECLERVGSLHVRSTGALTSLQGLEALGQVDGEVVIHGNVQLESLAGLDTLEAVGTEVEIMDNPALTDVDGLGTLVEVGSALVIQDNPALEQIDGLISLESVGENLEVRANERLASLAGLDRLERVDGSIFVTSNPALTDLGLRALEQVGERLAILHNDSLSGCEIDRIITRLEQNEFGGELSITGNTTCE